MPSKVFMICDAYEHGVGPGMIYSQAEKDRLSSAYADPELLEAYCLGFDKGQESYKKSEE